MGKNIDNRSSLSEAVDDSLQGFLALKTPEFAAAFKAYQDFSRTLTPGSPQFFSKMREFMANNIFCGISTNSSAATSTLLDNITKSFINKISHATDGSAIFFLDATAPQDQSLAHLTEVDLERFTTLTSQDPDATPYLKRLLLALIIYYRRNFHHSGWVRYARDEIFFLAGLSALPPKSQEDLTQHLFKEYGFSLRVIGSNNPIPCFMIDWVFKQPDSKLLSIGPYLPKTIDDFLATGVVEDA